ncbi:MAG: thiamine pyrophosphate-binding protein, partial [Alphaproteobacteria bacterium]|nr:thiamine pyrophosphate-binding protein [Alphaproteobacteria bacterium]
MNDAIEGPLDQPDLSNQKIYGSDLIADALREQKFPYICLNPGASYRGLHDSLVNYLGNKTPEIITCMHEEHAVG